MILKMQLKIATMACLLAVLFSVCLAAQNEPVADLAVEIVESPSPLTPGSFGEFVFRLTNHGPDPAGATSNLEYPIFVVSDGILELPTGPEVEFGSPQDSTCPVTIGFIEPIPGDPPKVDYGTNFRPLAAGESVDCQVFYHVNGSLDHVLAVTWRAISLRNDDPNHANDTFVLVFNAAAADIPTLTPTGSAVLIVALFVAFVVVRRRAATAQPLFSVSLEKPGYSEFGRKSPSTLTSP